MGLSTYLKRETTVIKHGTAYRTSTALLTAALLSAFSGCGSPAPRQPDADRGAPNASAREADRPTTGDGNTTKDGTRGGFTLVASGDILPHDSIIEQASKDAGGAGHDFRPMLADAKPIAEGADIALCHMETVYGQRGGPFSGYPEFKTPPEVASAIKNTGYHSCSTASNHTLDAGVAGVSRTLDAMDRVGLQHVGSARSAAERGSPPMLDAAGATVAHLAYTYGTNKGQDERGVLLTGGRPWVVNLTDPEQIITDARAARRAGADVVVVSMHWGTEWQEAPDEAQLTLAEQLTAARSEGRRDIDLILGTHAHVPQAYEKVNGTWVVYGMGDQIAGEMSDPRGSMGSTARFTFAPPRRGESEWSVQKAEFIPHVVVSEPKFRLVDLAKNPGETDDRAQYAQARNLITRAVLSRGAASDGLRIGR